MLNLRMFEGIELVTSREFKFCFYAGTVTEYAARVVMPGSDSSSEKTFTVKQSPTGINSIGHLVLVEVKMLLPLLQHTFLSGESVRVISDNGRLPDGVKHNNLYYAITSGMSAVNTNIKLLRL